MKTNADRVEGVVLVLIVLTVGGLAGAASFTHVHDWTMANSPTGTGDWFGWANAAISELLPLAALLTIRRRRRTGGPVGYPLFLLVCAVALSLAAQLAVARESLSGWLLSAVPALAFLGLSKLVFSTTPTLAVPVDQPADTGGWSEVPPGYDPTEDHRPAAVTEAVDEDQAVTVAPARPVAVQRPGLVPVPAAAFAPRNGTPYGSERDQ
ncbi:hypothetical protein MCAG_03410 [Micromonospora sp. ATCC 39149]|uniref:DUF2637 domain-containing protein n=1 Tax=Micromonospora carbonacea TaxID=47853 RepID=A0A7D6CDZ1_9ACTN|nr:hypothetical protein [Micromonospora sp. ATCC 39149]EEP73083.1 hypothetical protein MCAG_03410 [Micromonospora sp. ATCC 39149]QLJ99130.1 DUF2637 domain-containing protein [Micromonospora carbonacea]